MPGGGVECRTASRCTLWHWWETGVAFAAAVPETAVDEDDRVVFREDDIGAAREFFGVETEAVAEAVEEAAHADFGGGVFAADAAHVPGAAGFGEAVFVHRHELHELPRVHGPEVNRKGANGE